jgi:hypothetical protein
MFHVSRPAGQVGGVTPTQRVETKSSASEPKELTVLIFTDTDPRHLGFAETLVNLCTEGNLTAEHMNVRGTELPAKIRDLREQGKIGDGTQIIIDMHGEVDSEKRTHLLDGGSITTFDVVESVRKEDADGKKCCANVYITACMTGHNALREQLQELHNDQPSGACYLLSSKNIVVQAHYQSELIDMCTGFARAKSNSLEAPSEHIILTRMTSYQADCISMINRDGVTIRHAPKVESQFAIPGLIADIESRLPSKAGPSGQTRSDAERNPDASSLAKLEEETSGTGGKTHFARKEKEKPNLYASESNAQKLHVAAKDLARELHQGTRDEQAKARRIAVVRTEQQWGYALVRKVCRSSNGGELIEALQSDCRFWEGFQQEDWNEFHEFFLTCLLDAASIEDETNTKANRLIEFIKTKSSLFNALDHAAQTSILHRLNFSTLNRLIGAGFFENIGETYNLFAKFPSFDAMKTTIEASLGLTAALGASVINRSHGLVVATLYWASMEPDSPVRDEKVDYLCSLLSGNAKRFMREASQEDLKTLLTWIPKPVPSSDAHQSVFSLLRHMFNAGTFDIDAPRKRGKLLLLLEHLQPQLKTLVEQASAHATLFISRSLAFAPEFAGNEWANCHYSLMGMLDGALLDADESRRAEKVEICKKALEPKKDLFLAANNRQALIGQMNSELQESTIQLLTEMGFIPQPAPSRKRRASEIATTGEAASAPKEPRLPAQ